MVRHPQTGKYRRTRLFVLTLGYSRKAVRLLVWHSSTQVWAELHERAFRRLGGTVRVIVYDLKVRQYCAFSRIVRGQKTHSADESGSAVICVSRM
jgi:transposase